MGQMLENKEQLLLPCEGFKAFKKKNDSLPSPTCRPSSLLRPPGQLAEKLTRWNRAGSGSQLSRSSPLRAYLGITVLITAAGRGAKLENYCFTQPGRKSALFPVCFISVF